MVVQKNKVSRYGVSILFYGLIWGGIEATGGWFIHFFHIQALMPFLVLSGAAIMIYAIIKTGVVISGISVAFVAAMIKSLNLLLIGSFPLYWVLNPMMHILLQGIIVTFTCAILKSVLLSRRLNISVLINTNQAHENNRNSFGRGKKFPFWFR